MIIRPATKDDIEPALQLIKEFHEESINEYDIFCDEKVARVAMTTFIDTSLIAEKDGKIIGVISGAFTKYALDSDIVLQEIMWFVTKKYRRYGVLMFKEFERYAREVWNCKKLVMVHMGNSKSEKLERFYLKHGFKFLEIHYIKTL